MKKETSTKKPRNCAACRRPLVTCNKSPCVVKAQQHYYEWPPTFLQEEALRYEQIPTLALLMLLLVLKKQAIFSHLPVEKIGHQLFLIGGCTRKVNDLPLPATSTSPRSSWKTCYRAYPTNPTKTMAAISFRQQKPSGVEKKINFLSNLYSGKNTIEKNSDVLADVVHDYNKQMGYVKKAKNLTAVSFAYGLPFSELEDGALCSTDDAAEGNYRRRNTER